MCDQDNILDETLADTVQLFDLASDKPLSWEELRGRPENDELGGPNAVRMTWQPPYLCESSSWQSVRLQCCVYAECLLPGGRGTKPARHHGCGSGYSLRLVPCYE